MFTCLFYVVHGATVCNFNIFSAIAKFQFLLQTIIVMRYYTKTTLCINYFTSLSPTLQ